ncbi:MAG: YihY/virulence factor BrkB family protein [Anaerolineales bacterium]
MKAVEVKNIFVDTAKEWSEDQGSRLAAALAYYTAFSLAPLLVIVLAVAGLVGGKAAASGILMSQLQDLFGVQGREFIQGMIENATIKSTGITASVIGTITLLLGALGTFNELQGALNRIWDVKPKPLTTWGARIKDFLFKRLLSFSMVLGIGFLLLVSLIVSAIIAAMSGFFTGLPIAPNVILQVINQLVSLAIITLLFALIFKYVPDIKISWRHVLPGALLTAILFTIGKYLIGLYLGTSNVGSTFGAAGSLALIMIWIYYSAQILFLGAEFTQVFDKKLRPHPTAHVDDKVAEPRQKAS